jgi:hypothetical protein
MKSFNGVVQVSLLFPLVVLPNYADWVDGAEEYVGLEFYERALYMYWTNSRMMTIDQ